MAGKIDIILFSKSLVLDSEATTEGWMWKLRRCRLDLSADQKMIPSRKVFDRTRKGVEVEDVEVEDVWKWKWKMPIRFV